MEQLWLHNMGDIPFKDAAAIRSDYEILLSSCARLMAYAQSSPENVYALVRQRQDRLAEDDTVLFAFVPGDLFRQRHSESLHITQWCRWVPDSIWIMRFLQKSRLVLCISGA